MFSNSWNRSTSWMDEMLHSFLLQSGEKEIASAKGAFKLSSNGEQVVGKVFVTNLRVAVIPLHKSEPVILNLAWNEVKLTQVKISFLYSAALFSKRDGSLISIASTRSLVKALVQMNKNKSDQLHEMETSNVFFSEKEIATRCEACTALAIPPLIQCKDCLRDLSWPSSMENIIKLASSHSNFLPYQLPSGEPSRGDLITKDVAILSAACQCLGEFEFVQEAERWAESIINGQPIHPSELMNFPVLKRFGPHSENERLWSDAKDLPRRLFGNQ
jgi:hypothetical protein